VQLAHLATHIRALSLTDAIKYWDALEAECGLTAVRELCLVDRFYLLTRVCKRHDALHSWIYARCREVEAAPDDYLDLWARFHYKSTIITFAGTIQEILRNPEITIAILSHTYADAAKAMRQIKLEFENNQALQIAFPDILFSNPQKDAPTWSEEKGIVVKRQSNPKVATVEAHGLIDGMPTGSHYMLRIYDDVVTDKAVTTPEQIEKATRAWELSDNLGMPQGRRWHIGTRYSFADTYESILKRGILKSRVYPATHDGTPNGDPVLVSKEHWEEIKKTQTGATLACQMLQNPIAGEQAFFDVKWLQIYEIRPETLNVYLLIDPARSMKKDSDNTAMAVVGVDYARNKYLLDGFNHRMQLKERFDKMVELRRKWLNSPGIQSVFVGYEAYGAQADLDYFNEKFQSGIGSFEITELKWPREGLGSKQDRVQRLEPDFRAGRFYLPYDTDVKKLTSNQLKVNEHKPYRIAKPIKQRDSEGNIYDLTQHFKEQVHFFPFGGLKDLVDAVSRIYDMEPVPPVIMDQKDLEPEAYAD